MCCFSKLGHFAHYKARTKMTKTNACARAHTQPVGYKLEEVRFQRFLVLNMSSDIRGH